MSELKPCPFCGSPNVELVQVGETGRHFTDKFAVRCEYTGLEQGCGAEGQWNKSKEIAAAFWNTRHDSELIATQKALKNSNDAADKTESQLFATQDALKECGEVLNSVDKLLDALSTFHRHSPTWKTMKAEFIRGSIIKSLSNPLVIAAMKGK